MVELYRKFDFSGFALRLPRRYLSSIWSRANYCLLLSQEISENPLSWESWRFPVWWEQAIFPDQYECQVLYLLVISDFSLPNFRSFFSSHIHGLIITLENSWGNFCRSPGLSKTSSLPLCSTNSSCLGLLPRLSALSSQLKKSTRLHVSSISWNETCNFKTVCWGNTGALLICFTSPRDHYLLLPES